MKGLVLLILLSLMVMQVPVFSGELTAKMVMDTNAGSLILVYYDGDKELARKLMKEDGSTVIKGKIPDGSYKIYNTGNYLLGIYPHKNGKMNGEALVYNPVSGERKAFFKDDKEVVENYNCKREGNKENCYYDNGKLHQSDTFYPDGKLKTHVVYNEQGKTINLYNYNTKGELHGMQKYLFENGSGNTAVFTNGEGWVKLFDKNGKILEYYRAVSNSIDFHDGPSKQYNESGKLTGEYRYETNVLRNSINYLDGGYTIIRKYEDWGCSEEKEYTRDKKLAGESRSYLSEGVIYGHTKNYENEDLVFESETSNSFRLWDKSFKDRIKIAETKYLNDWNMDYTHQLYYDDGVLQKVYTVRKGKMSGPYKEYFPNAQIKEDCGYTNGNKDGLDRIYDEDGRILAIDTYKNGYKTNAKKYDTDGKQVLNQDYPYKPEPETENSAPELSDTLRTAFFNTGKFKVIERTKIAEVLEEQTFQLTGLTSTEDAAKMGNILNVSYLSTGSIAKIGGEFVINIRVIQVESAEIAAAETARCGSEKDLVSATESLVKKISDKLVSIRPESLKNTMAVLDIDFK